MSIAIEIIVATTVVLLIARALAARTARASLRHLVRLGGFVALLLLPAFVTLLPSEIVLHSARSAIAVPLGAAHAPAPVATWIAAVLITVWAGGVLVLLVRAGLGAMALCALWRRSQAHNFPARRIVYWTARARLAQGWSLRVSRETEAPISWGVLRPAVLLPESSVGWDATELDAAMMHELAHLRRRDSLAQALAMLTCAIYWPHPLVWREARALKAEAESAADDAVILSGVRPSDYADLLLRVASAMRHRSALEFSMAQRQGLEARIRAILASRPRAGVTRMHVFRMAAMAMGAALVLALARPTFAETQALPLLAQNVSAPPVEKTPASEDPSTPQNTVGAPSEAAPPPAVRTRATRRHVRNPATVNDRIQVDPHIGERVAKALADAHIGETVAKAVADAHVGEIVAKALADAHIDEKIAQALAAAQPAIDAAVTRAQGNVQAVPETQPAPMPNAAP